MFPKNQRIIKKEDFDLIFKKGKIFNSSFFTIRILKNSLNRKRFGILVSKKVSSKATDRNKIKRILRESIKKNIQLFPPGTDSVFYSHPKSINLSLDDAIKNIKNILKTPDL